MDLLTRAELRLLIERQHSPCVSLFLPTHRAAADVHEDQLRFKNLLKRAENELRGWQKLRTPEIDALLRPLASLLEEELTWRFLEKGLAAYAAPGFFRTYRVPQAFEEQVFVNNHFHITPILLLLQTQAFFALLAVSQKNVRLLRGSDRGIWEVFLREFPGGTIEALGDEAGETSLQFHTIPQQSAIFHGSGGMKDYRKVRLQEFLRLIDELVSSLLRGESMPLVFAGADPLFGYFRAVCSYPHLLPEAIRGNPDDVTDSELRARGWSLVAPLLEKRLLSSLSRFAALEREGRASRDLGIILPAAYRGKVEILFIDRDASQPGNFDPLTQELTLHPFHRTGNADLLDLATIQTLLHSGEVFPLPGHAMPGGSAVAAGLRVPVGLFRKGNMPLEVP